MFRKLHFYGDYSDDFESEIFLGDKKLLEGRPDKDPYPSEFNSNVPVQRLFFYEDSVENLKFDIVTIKVYKGHLTINFKILAEYRSIFYNSHGQPIFGHVIKPQPMDDPIINFALNNKVLQNDQTWHAKENDILTFYHLRLAGPDCFVIPRFDNDTQQLKYFESKKYFWDEEVNSHLQYVYKEPRWTGNPQYLQKQAIVHFKGINK